MGHVEFLDREIATAEKLIAKQALVAYLGLDPKGQPVRRPAAAQRPRSGRISKRGTALARWALASVRRRGRVRRGECRLVLAAT